MSHDTCQRGLPKVGDVFHYRLHHRHDKEMYFAVAEREHDWDGTLLLVWRRPEHGDLATIWWRPNDNQYILKEQA